jgi:hypothetical protein
VFDDVAITKLGAVITEGRVSMVAPDVLISEKSPHPLVFLALTFA